MLKFEHWRRTVSEHIPELEAWDENDEWYIMINRRRWLWFWHVAYVPTGSDDCVFEYTGLEISQSRAQKKAERMAQRECARRSNFT